MGARWAFPPPPRTDDPAGRVFAAYELLRRWAEHEPWSGLHAEVPGLDARADRRITEAVALLRGRSE